MKLVSNKYSSVMKFLNINTITHDNKIQTFLEAVDRASLSSVTADFAEDVLSIFEQEHPTDDRPEKALAAARMGLAAMHMVQDAKDSALTCHSNETGIVTPAFYVCHAAAMALQVAVDIGETEARRSAYRSIKFSLQAAIESKNPDHFPDILDIASAQERQLDIMRKWLVSKQTALEEGRT